MKKYSRIILISFLSFSFYLAKANKRDTISYLPTGKQNIIEVGILGNNYLSPFFGFLDSEYGISPLCISYSRSVYRSNSHFQFSLGLSTFRSYYTEREGTHFTIHKPWALCVPTGFLWRIGSKRYGPMVGIFYTSAFVRQDYYVPINRNTYKQNITHYDYQIMPNLGYEFRTMNEELIFKIAYTPKISSALTRHKEGYEWTIFPVWFGFSIGGGW